MALAGESYGIEEKPAGLLGEKKMPGGISLGARKWMDMFCSGHTNVHI